jgi:3-oxoacyl-[acyl-carrier protein] reductase
MENNARVALITGGANGLGEAIVRRLDREGIVVVIGDRDIDAAQALASAIGGQALAVEMDVADEMSVQNALATIEVHFGRLDIVVNNAGVAGERAPVEALSLADWQRTININLTGTFLVTRAVIPIMKRQKSGRIIMVASQAARGRTGTGKSQYAASKAGIVGFARVLADEVGRDGITVNSVAPSRTTTSLTLAKAAEDPAYFQAGIDQTALGRLAEPEDTANAVAFLCSDQAGFLTGAIIDVTGGAFMP